MADASPTDERVFAGVELGGTKGIALVWRAGRIVEQHQVSTTSPDETLGALGDCSRRIHCTMPLPGWASPASGRSGSIPLPPISVAS